MNSDLAHVFLLSLLAMLNPTLLAAVAVMLFLPSPKKLMFGYLLGAYVMSITLGLVIVFSLHGSSAVSSAKHTLSPVEDIVVGVLALAIAFVLGTGRDEPVKRRRERRRQAKEKAGNAKAPWSQRMLDKGSARVTFAVGAVLSFPGVAYLDALDHIVKLNPGTGATILLVVYFCLMQQLLLEVPLLGYVFAPKWTQNAVTRFKAWLSRSGRRAAVIGLTAVGVFVIGRGLVTLLT
jgi:hypothetical protein